MPPAARLSDPATHLMTPIAPGICSPDVMIGFMKAWRALPAGMGAGVESAMNTMKGLMDAATLDPVSTPLKLTQINAALMQDAGAAAAHGAPAATGAVSGGFTTVTTANVAATTAYTAAAAVPGGEPAARQAYTLAMKAAAAAFTSAAMSAIAGMTDIHICPQPSGPIPHGPGVVTKGSKSVFINGLPACREGDKIFEAAGGPDPIKLGCQTVLIGDDGGSPGSPDTVEEAVEKATEEAKDQSVAEAMTSAADAGTPLVEICETRQPLMEVKHKVAFRVVMDETNEPVAGVTLKITLPDGTVETHTTASDGMIEIDDLEQPGTCSVTSDIKGTALTNTFDFVRMGEGQGHAETAAEEPDEPAPAPSASTPAAASGAPATAAAPAAATGSTKTLSGTSWKKWRDDNVTKSSSIDDLVDPFKTNVTEFKKALEDAGATVSVTDTLRDKKEAYLWHWAWKIDQDGYDAKTVPANADVPIEWNHGDDAKSKQGAKEMVTAFGLAVKPNSKYAPALDSNHLSGKAIDMDISWTSDLKIKKKDGSEVTIKGPGTGAASTELNAVGDTYGVKKLEGDDPHWSHNGK